MRYSLLAAALLCASAHADSGKFPQRIQDFVDCNSKNFVAKMNALTGDREGAKTMLEQVPKCLDDAIVGALDEAGQATDLRAAIKDMFVKSKAYNMALRYGSKYEANKADSELQQAMDKFDLEAKLANKGRQ